MQEPEATEEITEPTEEVAEEEVVEEIEGEEAIEEEEEVEEEVAPLPPKQTAQERINEITRLRREAERRAERAEARLREKEGLAQPKPQTPAQLPPRPTIDKFETTEMYEDALFEWRDQVQSAKAAVAEGERAEAEALRIFNENAKDFRKEHPDFDDVIENPVFTPNMRYAILQSENGPQVAYHLGLPKNKDIAEHIRRLTVERQLYEVGKLETQILIAKKTRKVPSAPAPIQPVGMSGVSGAKDPSKMTTAEWMEWDKQQELAKLKKQYG